MTARTTTQRPWTETALEASLWLACAVVACAPRVAPAPRPDEPAASVQGTAPIVEDGGQAPPLACDPAHPCPGDACCLSGVCSLPASWAPSTGPEARVSAAVTTGARRLFVVGGASVDGRRWLGDAWMLDLSTRRWSQLALGQPAAARPAPRTHASLVYDARRARLLLHGGRTGDPDAPSTLNDLWALSLDTNRWEGLPSTRARFAHAAAYDPRGDRMLVVGGFEDGSLRASQDMHAFELSSATWTPLPQHDLVDSVGPISGHALAYDPTSHRLLLYGGRGDQDDPPRPNLRVLALELRAGARWTTLAPECMPGGCPRGRWGSHAAWDDEAAALFVLGGRLETRIASGELWRFDTRDSRWAQLSEVSGSIAALAVDAPARQLVSLVRASSGAVSLVSWPLACP